MSDPSLASSGSSQRGAALVIVLAFAALLSGLAGATMRSSVSGARAAALFADICQADQLAQGAADMVAHYVATGGPERSRGGGFVVTLATAAVSVDYVSESARIDANKAPLALISALLTAAGAEPAQVTAISNRINAFRAQTPAPRSASPMPRTAPADGQVAEVSGTPAVFVPEAEDAASSPPAVAETPLIQHPDEISEAWGLPTDLAQALLPALTVNSRSDKVDPVLAGRLVLSALLGGDPDRVDDYIKRRDQGFANPEAALALVPQQARVFASFADVSTLRAVAQVTVAGRFERRYELILQPAERLGQVPRTLSWHPLI